MQATTADAIQTLTEAVDAIADNARFVRELRRDKIGWDGQHPATRDKLLMELRHDLEDALKQVRILEDAEE